MSTIVSDWKSTLHHLGVQRSDHRATEQDFPFIYEFSRIPEIPENFSEIPENFHEIPEISEKSI